MPFQPFWTNRVLKVRVRSYLGHFGRPWPKYGTPPAKTPPQLCQNLNQDVL